MRILQAEDIYKNFYSKLFLEVVDSDYITLLSKVYLTEDGTIYLEGQNIESRPVLNKLEKQIEILESNYEQWEVPKEGYIGNPKRALEFLEDKLNFLEKISEDLRVK